MVEINKVGNTIIISTDKKNMAFPASAVLAYADKESDFVNIRLKATRKNVIGFNYKDATPSVESAEAMVEYISSLV